LSTPTLPDAVAVSAEVLMSDPARFIDGTSDAVLVVCDIGVRSDVIATQLHLDGYETVASLEGGIAAWSEAGYPTRAPAGLSADEYIRYDRQLKLPDFGIQVQQAVRDARVAIVGVGGLGVPVLSYLTGAGVGHLTIIDSDNVEISNLHRQPIYSMLDIGEPKAEVAAAYAAALNPTIEIAQVTARIDESNAAAALAGHDVVVTCTDSFETAHAINAAAVELRMPMVFGSVYRSEGQFAVFDATAGPCYACIFPPQRGSAGLDCSIVGVLGPVTGVVGSLQAVETLKVIAGNSGKITGSLKLYDAHTETIETLTTKKDPACGTCGT
jgi:molybdopterin/thiamine biosynthesis adenylyltransferase